MEVTAKVDAFWCVIKLRGVCNLMSDGGRSAKVNPFFNIFVVPSIMLYSSEIQQDATIAFLFSAMALLYMFRATISPIIRSTYAVYGHR